MKDLKSVLSILVASVAIFVLSLSMAACTTTRTDSAPSLASSAVSAAAVTEAE